MYKRKLLESSSLYSKIIDAMKATLFEKSEETEQHAERLKYYARKMAERMNLSENEKNDIELLAALHDIGKIAIDDRVLKKPGKLTKQDWTEMKKHPEAGYRIAMSTPVLRPIAGYILSHQEHYDGNGYPSGLSGEEIPLLSRIISVVDAYDAMTQDRIYRKAMSHAAAVKELKIFAGTQFDPKVVDTFLELLEEERGINKKRK
jgi:HD-GYP domain-containing protein (c-di-GMP phosphodiesterase class II)